MKAYAIFPLYEAISLPPLLTLEAKKTKLPPLIVFLLCGFWELKTFQNHNFSTTIDSSLVPLAKCSFLYKI